MFYIVVERDLNRSFESVFWKLNISDFYELRFFVFFVKFCILIRELEINNYIIREYFVID